MLCIGLTGGIGSGKTTVSSIFRALNIPVYEADTEARRLMETNEKVCNSVRALLGEEAYSSGKLNRSFIGKMVFRDQELLNELNCIVHPAVHIDFLAWAGEKSESPYVIEEAAILFESGAANRMDYIIFVKSDEETRIERVMKRDGLSKEEVMDRMSKQMDDIQKELQADFVVNNNYNEMLLPQVIRLHEHFLELNNRK
ncbi:dephospho-CoA kinase [Bacteroidota bacterium]